ncbi:two-component system, response regulator YesN [Paenibacillus catalpae]|uniref:Two-component system, response regulator YesN n=1 Tax=Paenibacillus catalpae TaxID=1045775 RepID=A0A1I2BBC1_9BACL|nr:response regulator [Paenibacillus catalpae]SFE53445.1 two-component system, response regulator YesN [Paenibacillus catalpae]
MRLILVDDEKGIVDGLKKMISRYIPECEVVGTAHNGVDGFKLIQKMHPDIVITDIRMPQADGLDMIGMLQEANVQTKFILLSGYADFEYARRGMQLGVQFYINKPVEEDELRDCMYTVMKTIQAEKVKRREVDDLKQEVHSLMQENALRDLLDIGSENEDVMEELLRIARIPSAGTWFACMLLEFYGPTDNLKDSGIQQVLDQIDQVLEKYRGVYRFRYSGSQIAVIVSQGRSIGYADLVSSVHRLKEQVYQQIELSMTVGVGTVQKGAAGIGLSFEEARHALSYKVIKGANAVIAYPEIHNLTGRSQPVPEVMITKLEAALENLDEREGAGIIREIFRVMEAKAGMSPTDLQLQCLNILLSSVRKMSFQQLQQNDFLGRHILSLEGMSRFQTLESLEEWMVEVIRKIIVFKQEHHIPKKKDIIAEVKEYVSEHYNEPITLADLSARFFISPYYLSQFFKQKTGDTYVNYLTRIRIGKAKELLEKTDLKVYEVCQMVGYSDTQHFARMFEKLTGYKPRDYRKQLPNV